MKDVINEKVILDYSIYDPIDLDLLYLEYKQTSLPFNGTGVFARTFIPQYALLCEYRGDIFPEDADVDPTRAFHIQLINGSLATLVGKGLCPEINDCAWVYDHPFSKDDLILMKSLNKEIPCRIGYKRNAKAISLGHKLLVIAARDIFPGEEIFYYYGDQYWYPIVHTKIKATKSYGKKKIKKFSENIANEIKVTFTNPVLVDS